MANAWLDGRFSAVMNDTMVTLRNEDGKPVKMGETKMRDLGRWLLIEADKISEHRNTMALLNGMVEASND